MRAREGCYAAGPRDGGVARATRRWIGLALRDRASGLCRIKTPSRISSKRYVFLLQEMSDETAELRVRLHRRVYKGSVYSPFIRQPTHFLLISPSPSTHPLLSVHALNICPIYSMAKSVRSTAPSQTPANEKTNDQSGEFIQGSDNVPHCTPSGEH